MFGGELLRKSQLPSRNGETFLPSYRLLKSVLNYHCPHWRRASPEPSSRSLLQVLGVHLQLLDICLGAFGADHFIYQGGLATWTRLASSFSSFCVDQRDALLVSQSMACAQSNGRFREPSCSGVRTSGRFDSPAPCDALSSIGSSIHSALTRFHGAARFIQPHHVHTASAQRPSSTSRYLPRHVQPAVPRCSRRGRDW